MGTVRMTARTSAPHPAAPMWIGPRTKRAGQTQIAQAPITEIPVASPLSLRNKRDATGLTRTGLHTA